MLDRQVAASNTLTTETFFIKATKNGDISNIVCPWRLTFIDAKGPQT